MQLMVLTVSGGQYIHWRLRWI